MYPIAGIQCTSLYIDIFSVHGVEACVELLRKYSVGVVDVGLPSSLFARRIVCLCIRTISAMCYYTCVIVTLSIINFVLHRTGILLLLIKHMLFPFFSFYHFIKAYMVVTRFILWSTHMFFLLSRYCTLIVTCHEYVAHKNND